MQVTSTASIAKIKKTVDGINKEDLFKDIDRLIVLNITKKSKYQIPTYGEIGKLTINIKKDVLDYRDLMRFITSKKIEEIKAISAYLDQHFNIDKTETIPKEVATILGLIEILSNEEHPNSQNGFLEKPDPQNKIYVRFLDYSEYLTTLYSELALIYNGILKTIEHESDNGTLAMNKLATYLRIYSHSVLSDCHDDPIKAIEKMAIYYGEQLAHRGIDHEYSAIQFYLLHSLINCNVFPNIKSHYDANSIL